jgi:hypothetical protein
MVNIHDSWAINDRVANKTISIAFIHCPDEYPKQEGRGTK